MYKLLCGYCFCRRNMFIDIRNFSLQFGQVGESCPCSVHHFSLSVKYGGISMNVY
jgi:hypothetical protein